MGKRKVKSWCLAILMTFVAMICLGGISPVRTAQASEENLSGPHKDADGNTEYDCVWFGRYPQDDATGRIYDPIKWRVLSVNGDDIFLIADKILDCRPFNSSIYGQYGSQLDINWGNSGLRNWLNDVFYKKAFSSDEQAAIKTTTVSTSLNTMSDKYSSKNKIIKTNDKVFLLSTNEAEAEKYGFYDINSRYRVNTNYAKARGAYTYNTSKSDLEDEDMSWDYDMYRALNGKWWLRTAGWNINDATIVTNTGMSTVFGNDNYAKQSDVGVCPVIHISKSSSAWKYAGTINTDPAKEAVEVNKPASVSKAGWTRNGSTYSYIGVNGDQISKPAGWYYIYDKYIYVNAAGEKVSRKTDWYNINGKIYYVLSNGERVVKPADWYKVHGKYYYLSAGGTRKQLKTGWYKVHGHYYYLKSNGVKVKKKTGWYNIGSKYYYLDDNGVRQTMPTGWYMIGRKMYYISRAGNRIRRPAGWRGDTYICSDGSLFRGWKRVGGKKYYFNNDGSLAGEGVEYSSKLKKYLYRFTVNKKTFYQSRGMGVMRQQAEKMFASIKKKYPNRYEFEGIGDRTQNQCDIFTYAVGQQLTGIYPRGNWKKIYNINAIKPGDIIKRDNGPGKGVHYIMVTGVYGDFFQFVDANGSGNWSWGDGYLGKNRVLWDQWSTKSRYKEWFVFALQKP